MKITSKPYGTLPNGEVVTQYTLENDNGLSASILNYGGVITHLFAPDKNGNTADVVLGHKGLEEYLTSPGYFGSLVGRNANRIRGANVKIDEEEYKLAANDGENNLHGGLCGLNKRLFSAEMMTTCGQPALVLSLKIADMEDDFPGNIDVSITYSLTDDNSFIIAYRAISDKDTIINLTNHSYFNMAGHESGNVLEQTLELASSFFTPNASDSIPTGELRSVADTPFDLRTAKKIGEGINSDYEQIKMFGGYDHNIMFDGSAYRRVAEMTDPVSGRVMTVFTDLPCVQLYSGNKLPFAAEPKDGAIYTKHQGLCLETQTCPNAVQMPWLKSPIYPAGKEYTSTTAFKFSVR